MSTFGESLYGGVIRCRKIIAQEADLPSGGGGSGGTIEISGINFDNKWSISLDNDSNFFLTNDLVNVVGLSGNAHTGKITLYDFKLDDIADVDTTIKDFGSFMFYDSIQEKYEFTDKVRFLGTSLDVSSIPIVTSAGDLRLFNDDTSANIFLGGYTRNNPTLNGASVGIGHKAGDLNNKRYNVAIGVEAGEVEQGKDFLFFTGEAIAIGYRSGQFNQQPHTIAIGSLAGRSNQEIGAISIGYEAGQVDQSMNAISIGNQAGETRQNAECIAIGTLSGHGIQKQGAIAIGEASGYSNQGIKAIAIGSAAGRVNQNETAIGIGYFSAYLDQSVNSIAVGNRAGETTQNIECIAIGSSSGKLQQGKGIGSFIGESVAIGKLSGELNQHAYAISIGSSAGGSNQQNSALSIGYQAGATDQSANAIALGTSSGNFNQSVNSIGIGTNSGSSNQGINSIGIGVDSALVSQGSNSVAIGPFSGVNSQGNDAISIGHLSGRVSQQVNSISIGHQSGDTTLGAQSVAIGHKAGFNLMQANSVAIGHNSGVDNMSQQSVAIGNQSGEYAMGSQSVAIGNRAGNKDLGSSSIAIGDRASDSGGSFASTIVINGTGSNLNPSQASSTYIKPIRSLTQAQTLHYDDGTGEITRTPNVSLTQGDNITITGTYPAFTIAGTGGGGSASGVYATSTISKTGLGLGVIPLDNWVSQVSVGITSGTTNLFTTPTAGWYQLSFSLDQRRSTGTNFVYSYIYILKNGTVIHEIVDADVSPELENARTKGGGFLVEMAIGDNISFSTNIGSTGYSVAGKASFVKVDTAAPAAPPISSIAVYGSSTITTPSLPAGSTLANWASVVATGVTASTTDVFTIIHDGWYNLSFSLSLNVTATFVFSALYIFKNGVFLEQYGQTEPAGQTDQQRIFSGSTLLNLVAGDFIYFAFPVSPANNFTATGNASIIKVDTTAPAPSINSKVFMRMNTFLQTGTGPEQTITNWTPIISEPANLYQNSTNIFSPPRNGYYSINFQTSIKSTTSNSVNALIKLYQTDINGTLQLVSHSQEQEANDLAIGQTKYRFLNINIILYLVPTDSLYITTTHDGSYELLASPITNLSIHNVD